MVQFSWTDDDVNKAWSEKHSTTLNLDQLAETTLDVISKIQDSIASQSVLTQKFNENIQQIQNELNQVATELAGDNEKYKTTYNNLVTNLSNNIIGRVKQYDFYKNPYTNVPGQGGFLGGSWLDPILRGEYNGQLHQFAEFVTGEGDDVNDNDVITMKNHIGILIALFGEMTIKYFQSDLHQLIHTSTLDADSYNFVVNYSKFILKTNWDVATDVASIKDSMNIVHRTISGKYGYSNTTRGNEYVYMNNIIKLRDELEAYTKTRDRFDMANIDDTIERDNTIFDASKILNININADNNSEYNKNHIEAGQIIDGKLDDISSIGDAKVLSFAYENKYSIKLTLPKNINNPTLFLKDSPYIISSSIPSISIDSIESKINNRLIKSAGGIRHDTFNMTFRDTPDRLYYKLFLDWIRSEYDGGFASGYESNWRNNIRKYNYPNTYMGSLSMGLMYNYIRKGSDDVISELSNNFAKFENGTNTDVYTDSNRAFVEDLKSSLNSTTDLNIEKSDAYLGRTEYSIKSTIANITKVFKGGGVVGKVQPLLNKVQMHQISPIIVTYKFLHPVSLGDISLNSTSTDVTQFDVTFEYSNPIIYTIYNESDKISFEL